MEQRPRPAPERGGVVSTDHAVANTCHGENWRHSNEKWGRKPQRGECGGVVGKLQDSHTHTQGPAAPTPIYISILSSKVVTTLTTVRTFRPYAAERSVVRSVANCPSVATTPGLAPPPPRRAVVAPAHRAVIRFRRRAADTSTSSSAAVARPMDVHARRPPNCSREKF
nr:MAG TPA: hypothetical protein [Caudoviricetes sp.]